MNKMNMNKKISYIISCLALLISTQPICAQNSQQLYKEPYRPQIHFTPRAHWMNDPNGMVFSKGVYHLFFQYYPDSTVWGPMHWGHATSKDLIHWQEQPIALYPDSLGYIFSGSVVADKSNTAGFGKKGTVPLVAVFTHHNMAGEKEKRNDFQNQSLAYSNDDGQTWKKYEGNPVLKNPGINDFRDPKVMWYEPQKKWIMTLDTKDKITFYSSTNLKNWNEESEFGAQLGAHGGVWECPDLFTLTDNGKEVWVLTVSLNPGAPNGGSGTQYFLGKFNGKNFTTTQTNPKWIDYGPDNYAGVTWSNTGERKIFLGWMSNWLYATQVPTIKWRSAMTLPRTLKLKHVDNDIYIASTPVPELAGLAANSIIVNNISVKKDFDLSTVIKNISFPCRLNLSFDKQNFAIKIFNKTGEEVLIGYDEKTNNYFIDRTKAGGIYFNPAFAAKHTAPRISNNAVINISLIVDAASVELFADGGLSNMTEIFFPAKPFDQIHIQSATGLSLNKLAYLQLRSIY